MVNQRLTSIAEPTATALARKTDCGLGGQLERQNFEQGAAIVHRSMSLMEEACALDRGLPRNQAPKDAKVVEPGQRFGRSG
jgi:hypothetical protein